VVLIPDQLPGKVEICGANVRAWQRNVNFLRKTGNLA
jgi:hypothetical protein